MRVHPPVLGIDFGTTNTTAAWCDAESKIHLVPVAHKRYVLPSVAWFGRDGKILVGDVARHQSTDDPLHTVYEPKRFIGRRFNSEFVSRHKDRYPYTIVEDEHGGTAVELYGEPVSFVDVAFHVIHSIVELANAAAEQEFDEAVLTVPAHYSYGQRRGVRRAAEMAGLEVRCIVNEPTAAALFYAKHKEASGEVLVFDLGGGTFDATVLAVDRREVRVLGTGGDAFLGGRDFDDAIVGHLVRSFGDEHGIDIGENKLVLERVRTAAEAAKIDLSKNEATSIRVPFAGRRESGEFIDLEYVMARAELESLTEGLVARCLGMVEEVLDAIGLHASAVGEIVFIGGQTRMPRIRERLSQIFRHDPQKHVHPELGVAIGAAILGRTLSLPLGAALVDVIPIPIGVMAPGVGTLEVIPQNSPVPCTERTVLQRPEDGKSLMLAVYEAVDPTAVDRELLGTVKIPAEWLVTNVGVLELEMRMGHDFELTLAAISGSASMPLELRPPPSGR